MLSNVAVSMDKDKVKVRWLIVPWVSLRHFFDFCNWFFSYQKVNPKVACFPRKKSEAISKSPSNFFVGREGGGEEDVGFLRKQKNAAD